MIQILINTCDDGETSSAILSGYYKFYGATIARGYNGATAIIEIDEEDNSDKP